MLFQPIEESSRNLFAKLCADSESQGVTKTKGSNAKSHDKNVSDEKRKDLEQAASILIKILRFYSLISLVAFTIGPHLSYPLLALVAGKKWSATAASSVLASYCNYIPFLAINGVTEAFVAAVATSPELHTQSVFMFMFFGAFAGSAWVFIGHLGWGGIGVVAANGVNMGLRIMWNLWFIKKYFSARGVSFEIFEAAPKSSISLLTTATLTALWARNKAGVLDRFALGVFGELIEIGGIAGVYEVLM
jgi:small basic protein